MDCSKHLPQSLCPELILACFVFGVVTPAQTERLAHSAQCFAMQDFCVGAAMPALREKAWKEPNSFQGYCEKSKGCSYFAGFDSNVLELNPPVTDQTLDLLSGSCIPLCYCCLVRQKKD